MVYPARHEMIKTKSICYLLKKNTELRTGGFSSMIILIPYGVPTVSSVSASSAPTFGGNASGGAADKKRKR